MASLLHENRLKLQQRISQRLRGDVPNYSSSRVPDIISKYIPRRKKHVGGQHSNHTQTDPFRMQAQEFLYEDDLSAGDRWLRGEESRGPEDIQLPVLKPRFTGIAGNTHKGVPTQKYVDLIMDRKGPLHSLPRRYIRGTGNLLADKNYDDSMTIRSYRQTDSPKPIIQQDERDDMYTFSKIMLIAPQKIQYTARGSLSNNKQQQQYTLDKSTSTLKSQHYSLAAIKGTRLSSLRPLEEHDESTASLHALNRRNISFLTKFRKRLDSTDRKFIGEITTQGPATNYRTSEQGLSLRGKDMGMQERPLPPIRITVTNPLPVNSPASSEMEEVTSTKVAQTDDAKAKEGKLILKLTNTVKKKTRRKTKEEKKPAEKAEEPPAVREERRKSVEPAAERHLSDNGLLMPAPITKITFQSYHEGNLKKPKKSGQNVQVERVIQGDIMATNPNFVRREKLPAVKVSNFEMKENPRPNIVFRKDGTIGPAPPSTNYVNFQKTRQGGQSRVLLSLKNKYLGQLNGSGSRNWGIEDELLQIHTRQQHDSQYPIMSTQHEQPAYRKLGRIKAMKRSLAAAHNALMEAAAASDSDQNSKIEIDTVTDEGRSERSYESEQPWHVANHPRNNAHYYYNEPNVPSTLHPPITGFYMGRTNEEIQANEFKRKQQQYITVPSTRDVATEVEISSRVATPIAPPNTATFTERED